MNKKELQAFNAGWNAALDKIKLQADNLLGSFGGDSWDTKAGSSGYDSGIHDVSTYADTIRVTNAPDDNTEEDAD